MRDKPEDILNAYQGGSIRKILLVRISRLGDLLFTTPSIRALKRIFPDAGFHYLTNRYSAGVVAGNPSIEKIHLLERRSLRWRLLGSAPVLSTLKKEAYDLVVFFRWRKEYRRLLRRIAPSFYYKAEGKQNPGLHFVDRLVGAFEPFGATSDGEGMEMVPTEEERAEAACFLERNKRSLRPFFLLHPGCHQTFQGYQAKRPGKRSWPFEKWAHLVTALQERYDALPVLSQFSRGDRDCNTLILSRCGIACPVFTSKSPGAFAALMSEVNCFFCVDSGPLHIASAMNAPTVALFGPSRPRLTGPYMNQGGAQVVQSDLPCISCKGKKVKCLDNRCMKEITVEQVLEAAELLLQKQDIVCPAAIR